MPIDGYPAGFFPAEQVRAYLSTYRAVSGGAESEQPVNREPSLSVGVHADAVHITGQRAHSGPQISIQATEGTFPYVTLFLRDYEALEKLRDVCQSLLSGAWVAS